MGQGARRNAAGGPTSFPLDAPAGEERLRQEPEALRPLREALRGGAVTLVYGARDPERNHAVVLRDFLSETQAQSASGRRPARHRHGTATEGR